MSVFLCSFVLVTHRSCKALYNGVSSYFIFIFDNEYNENEAINLVRLVQQIDILIYQSSICIETENSMFYIKLMHTNLEFVV